MQPGISKCVKHCSNLKAVWYDILVDNIHIDKIQVDNIQTSVPQYYLQVLCTNICYLLSLKYAESIYQYGKSKNISIATIFEEILSSLKIFIQEGAKFSWNMTIPMQFLVDEVERVRLYNHNQTTFTVDIKETLGKCQVKLQLLVLQISIFDFRKNINL